MDWRASWSWPVQKETNEVSAVWGKACFETSGDAVLRISANHAYQLWVDGCFTGQGPDRADPRFLYEDTYSLKLEAGRHSVLVLVYHFWPRPSPESRAWCLSDGPPGVIGEIWTGDGNVLPLTWRMRRSEAWAKATASFSRFRGPLHDIDLTCWQREWTEAASDASAWPEAVTMAFGVDGFFPRPIPREIPDLVCKLAVPEGVTSLQAGRNPLAGVSELSKWEPQSPLVVTTDDEGAQLQLQFGKVFCGFLELTIEGDGNVEVFFGEGQMLKLQERLRISGCGTVAYRSLEWRGGDRVALRFFGIRKELRISNIRMVDMMYPFRNEAVLETDEPCWNQIWENCLRTARAGVRDHLMDCCGREQALWLEDICIHAKSLRCCFGDLRPVRKVLLQALRNVHPSGYVPVPGPAALGYNHAGEVLPWCAQALVLPGILRELLWWEEDGALAEWAIPRIAAVLDFFGYYRGENGLLALDPPGRPKLQHFCGWNPSPQEGSPCDLNAMYLIALREMAELLLLAGCGDLAGAYELRAEEMAATIQDRLWSNGHNLFRDGEIQGQSLDSFSITANALCGIAGIVPENLLGNWLHALAKNSRLIPPVSPYDASLLLMALCRYEADDAMGNLLTGYFGSISRGGHRYMPEFWQEHGGATAKRGDGSSLCHPYGTAPAFILSDYVLGVRSISAGGSRIRIEPRSLGLRRVSGQVPFPAGTVHVSWKREDTRWSLNLALPEGMCAEISLPRLGLSEQRLEVDGQIAVVAAAWRWSAMKFHPGEAQAKHSRERLECSIGPGIHRIETYSV